MILDRLIAFFKAAGAYRESDSERDGFLSYAAETHATGYGLGLGVAIVAATAGHTFVLELAIIALGGLNVKRGFKNQRVMRELRDEPQYFLGGLVAGLLVGAGVFTVV